MTAAASTPAAGGVKTPGFLQDLSSEWAKMSTWRSIRWGFLLAVVLSIAMSGLIAIVIGATYDDWSPAQQADFDPGLFALNGIVASLIAFSVLGAMAATSEYSSGMIRLTFTVTPRRGRVLLAKALLVAAITMVGGLISVFGMFLVGQLAFSVSGVETVGFADDGVPRMLLGVGLLMPVFPLLGVAIGFLLRSTAGAITAVLVLLWVPEIFGPLLPTWWQENCVSLLPGPAMDSVAIGHVVDSATFTPPLVGATITAVWIVGSLSLAYVVLRRRDA